MSFPSLRTFAAACLAACALASPGRAHDGPDEEHLTLAFGVYQTDKATVMYRMFTPLLESLQTELERDLARPVDIHLTIFKSYDDGIDALATGRVDFMHCGPSSYVTAKERTPGLRLLAMEHKDGEKRFLGVIAVAKDSPIQTLEDLRGKRFAFGDKNSTIGRYLVQAELVRHGLRATDLASYRYLERHDQAAAAVEHGDFDACSVKHSTFKKYEARGVLRAIGTFENVTKPMVARAGMDRKVARALEAALCAIKDPVVLGPLSISGFLKAADDEYEFVRDGMRKAEEFIAPPRG